MKNVTIKLYNADRTGTEKVILSSPSWAVFDHMMRYHDMDLSGMVDATPTQDEARDAMRVLAGRLLPVMLRDSNPSLEDETDAALGHRMVASEIVAYADAMVSLLVDALGGNRPNPATAAKP